MKSIPAVTVACTLRATCFSIPPAFIRLKTRERPVVARISFDNRAARVIRQRCECFGVNTSKHDSIGAGRPGSATDDTRADFVRFPRRLRRAGGRRWRRRNKKNTVRARCPRGTVRNAAIEKYLPRRCAFLGFSISAMKQRSSSEALTKITPGGRR